MSLLFDLEKVVNRFLALTNNSELWAKALQAITLHMFSGYAINCFQQFGLDSILTSTLEEIKETKIELSLDLSPLEGMSLIDIWYVLRERDFICPTPSKETFKAYLEDLLLKKGEIKYAWLLGEMAYIIGLDVRQEYLKRDYRFFKEHLSNIDYTYWLTHKFLLGTKYLQCPLPSFGFTSVTTELVNTVEWIIKEGSLDLAAEAAICLSLSQKTNSLEYKSLIKMIVDNINEDGTVIDPLLEDTPY
ncbi:MAG: D-aminopeptidase dipeptide-binding protein DppA, partial [bacterium]